MRHVERAGGYPPDVLLLQVLAFALGVYIAARTVLSAVRSFVVPRGDNDPVTRVAFA